MRNWIFVIVSCALLSTGAASADDKCGPGASSTVIELTDWTVAPNVAKKPSKLPTAADSFTVSDRLHMTETLTYTGEKSIRMVAGSIVFKDVLGGSIGSKSIDRDVRLAKNETYVQKGSWGPHTFERLLAMDRSDVVATACVQAVVHDDGTQQTFE